MKRITISLAAALAAATLAACGAAATETPDVTSPGQTAPEGSEAGSTDGSEAGSTDGSEAGSTDGSEAGSTDGSTDDDAPAAGSADEWRVRGHGQELVLEVDGRATVLYTLPDEGESVFRSVAVRPGGTSQDFTVVAVTSAEGTFDVRWLQVTDGQAGDLELFDEAYNIGRSADAQAYGDRAPAVVWAPEGDAVAFAEPGDDGAVLRIIGWADGPGTGDTADDNAAFGLEQVPNDAVVTAWQSGADQSTVVHLVDGTGAEHTVELDRQADGAWAIPGDRG